MSASNYIGRVGGLAAALGLGAAALVIGCGVAAADSPGDSPSGSLGSAGGEAKASAVRRTKESATGARAASPAGRTAARAADRVARPQTATAPGSPATVARAAAAVDLVPLPEVTKTVCAQATTACAYIVGPSGIPLPDETGPGSEPYDRVVMAWYVQPNSPPGTEFSAQVIATAEGAYPLTGVKDIPIDPSSQLGLNEVSGALEATLTAVPEGTPITYFGYSQSAIISSLLQIYQLNSGCETSTPACPPPAPPEPGRWPIPGLEPDQMTFVTVGQEMNPNGGWYSRFANFIVPGPGLVLYGATPEQTWARTINYTLEYDGFADYPKYPLNFLSSLNAALGIVLVHTQYANRGYFEAVYGNFDPAQALDPVLATFGPAVACKDPSSICKKLPTTPGTESTQEYYFIPTPNLPLLAALRLLPIVGEPLADLIQPALKVIVDLGYADWAHGFGTEADQPPANVLSEFGLFPDVNPLEVINKLVAGVQQGVSDFIADLLPGGSVSQELTQIGAAIQTAVSGIASGLGSTVNQFLTQPFALPTLDQVITTVQDVVSQVSGRIANAASALYATLLPLADFTNALLVSLPGYAVNLFLDGVQQAISGDLIEGIVNAFGRPVAAAVGFAGVIGVFQLAVFLLGAYAAVTGCGPAAPVTGFCIFENNG